jgi:hypothetical protein
MLVQILRWQRIGCFSVPNGAILGGKNRFALLRKLQKEGFLGGAPDLVLMDRTPDGRPVAIEMKRQEGGVSSDAQKSVHAEMRARGWVVIVAKGAEDALRQLHEVGIGDIRSVWPRMPRI